jgi:hypothetical protein
VTVALAEPSSLAIIPEAVGMPSECSIFPMNAICLRKSRDNTLEAADRIRKMEMKRLLFLSHSPDLSPCDFWCLGWAKTALRNRRFVDLDDVVETLIDIFNNVTFDELPRVFQNWIRRLEWVIRNSGEFFIE